MKSIAQTTGRTLAQIKNDTNTIGDLGIVAERSRSNQRMMFTPAPHTVTGMFTKLKEIAKMTGTSVNFYSTLIFFFKLILFLVYFIRVWQRNLIKFNQCLWHVAMQRQDFSFVH